MIQTQALDWVDLEVRLVQDLARATMIRLVEALGMKVMGEDLGIKIMEADKEIVLLTIIRYLENCSLVS